MVRDKNYLLWFSDLLNRAWEHKDTRHLDLNLYTHVTAKRHNISTHVFRYLLDGYQSPRSPYSALTGLKMGSHFGRPDLRQILKDFHTDMLKLEAEEPFKVGVFFCESPVIGRILSDMCDELTIRGLREKTRIKYEFRMEVFN